MMNSSPGVFSCWQVGGKHRYMDFLPLPILLVAPEMFLFFRSHLCRIKEKKFLFCGGFFCWRERRRNPWRQPFWGGGQALTVGFQSGGNKPPLVARRFEDVWSVWDWKENGGRRWGGHLNGRQSERNGCSTLLLLMFFSAPPPPSLPNGICLALNNSSIKSQVRNKELNSQAPLRPLWLSLKDGTLAARD